MLKKHPASFEISGQRVASRVTGVVDAPGNRFVCVLIEAAEIWVIDASKPDFPIQHRIKTRQDNPYDAMITPDGRYYVVGHMKSDRVSVLDLTQPEAGIREVSLRDPNRDYDKAMPVKLPHLASWAVAGNWIFVPLVGEDRLAVLDRATWEFSRVHPAARSPRLRGALADRTGGLGEFLGRRRRRVRAGDRRREVGRRRHASSSAGASTTWTSPRADLTCS